MTVPADILDYNTPKIMGVLNVTPDSFYSGTRFSNTQKAVAHATAMYEAGATWIDIGGESTRPGAQHVDLQEELDRTMPVIEAVRQAVDCEISIDTSKARVMQEAINKGVSLVNDIRSLSQEGAMAVVAANEVNVCLMHMQGKPADMQDTYHYDNLLAEIKAWFVEKIQVCQENGINRGNIIIDPGFGFGKADEHNLEIINNLDYFADLDLPIAIGVSRKSTIGRILDNEVDDRLIGSITLGVAALLNGANILRVHDVKETMDAVKLVSALKAIG